ncbi:YihY/virulence factor BrkB family protein [Tabrizicola soli]|uniref:YihY/virulence factor BrkB family protein n=1 Tax=Tabrizicola soli TaxID=2185115 RepID=A0ABV7DTD3_9RHOB|nr:YihY/virulence factor BrkB family protein [Tabrizicola soli]
MAIFRLPDLRGILRDLKDEILRDRVLAVAAGVTFYALLAIVPAITALISVFGLILAPSEVPELLAPLYGLLPEEAAVLVTDQATRIAAKADDALSLTALVALLIALWSANGGTKALIEALGIAYDVRETRSFVRLTLVALGFTLGALVLVILLGGAVAALPFLVERLGGMAEALVLILRWPVILALLLLVLAVLYRWGPDRPGAEWRWITPGAVLASLGLVLISGGMSWYVANFGSYDETYGSLAAVVVLMLWIWLSTMMVLVGAELNAELDRRSRR